jgi:hypothetical protein
MSKPNWILALETVHATCAEIVAKEAENIHLNPTPAQKKVGNYKKAHIRWNGLYITIETCKGGTRSAHDGSWKVDNLPAHYGYIKRTQGADGDHVDVYIGDDLDAKLVYAIDQKSLRTDKFDETKVMLGFDSFDEAKDAYIGGFSDGKGPDRIQAITVTTLAAFKRWLANHDTTKPFSELGTMKTITEISSWNPKLTCLLCRKIEWNDTGYCKYHFDKVWANTSYKDLKNKQSVPPVSESYDAEAAYHDYRPGDYGLLVTAVEGIGPAGTLVKVLEPVQKLGIFQRRVIKANKIQFIALAKVISMFNLTNVGLRKALSESTEFKESKSMDMGHPGHSFYAKAYDIVKNQKWFNDLSMKEKRKEIDLEFLRQIKGLENEKELLSWAKLNGIKECVNTSTKMWRKVLNEVSEDLDTNLHNQAYETISAKWHFPAEGSMASLRLDLSNKEWREYWDKFDKEVDMEHRRLRVSRGLPALSPKRAAAFKLYGLDPSK